MSERKQLSYLLYFLYTIIGTVLVYVFSIGPVVGLLTRSNGTFFYSAHEKWALFFYTPLILIVKSNTSLEMIAGEYLAFWVKYF